MKNKLSEELTPSLAYLQQRQGTVLVDIREDYERNLGQAEGSIAINQLAIEATPEHYFPNKCQPIMFICQAGKRSLSTTEKLKKAGYLQIYSVTGGTQQWQAENLPMVQPKQSATEMDFMQRYSRHFKLPNVGVEGQKKLQQSTVCIVGAGGLGSPIAFYLAAAGVGKLRIIDNDRVEKSNLQRQILHTNSSIGEYKVDSAKQRLLALNPCITIDAINVRVDSHNIEEFIQEVDIVVDGSDNFPLRYLLNDACIVWKKPLVYGAIQQFSGQVSVFNAAQYRGEKPCYRCLFPEPPSSEFAPNCAEAGVFGVLPGLIGTIQATEVIKYLLNIGESLAGYLLTIDALTMQFRKAKLLVDDNCPSCGLNAVFSGYIDYAEFCNR